MKIKKAEITLEYQNYIQAPPVAPQSLYQTAASNDGATMDRWRDVWLSQAAANRNRFGSFAEHGIGKIWGEFALKPAIIAGSGPSLKRNVDDLKLRGDIPLVSCLHNFHFFEDRGIKPNYYVTLDAGPVTIEEVSEGGSKTPEEYWAATKEHTLLAYIGTHPDLLAKWQGKVLFFNCPTADVVLETKMAEIEPFRTYVSPGGNVLGACLYIAKAILGANPIAFIGADFSFSYDRKFHGWESKYDKDLGHVLRTVDVFGNKILTWQSYHGFKCFFDYVTQTVPGSYYNCTEGGTFGAYQEGNIMSVQQRDLCDFIESFHVHLKTKPSCDQPAEAQKLIIY